MKHLHFSLKHRNIVSTTKRNNTKKRKIMNLQELDTLLERVKNDKELFNFYTKKRKELVKKIFQNVANQLN